MMLERSAAARYASSVFFERYNDFDVYVEDTEEGYDKIFATLLSRATANHISLQRVFPLGARGEVIAAAEKELMENKSQRKSVFIVDGDLYLLCGEAHELPENVVRLPRYCIENFLVDPAALHELLDDEVANRELSELQREFDYEGWIGRSTEHLRQLFIVFAMAHKLRSGLKTVKHGSSAVCGNGFADIDEHKAAELSNTIIEQLSQLYGEAEVGRARSEIESRVNSSCCFISTYVSGKDFLLPLMVLRLRSITKTKAPNLNLKLRFAKKCDTKALRDVVEAIGRVIGRSDLCSFPEPAVAA